MSAVISQLSEMVIMILIGYGCAKANITGQNFNRFTSPVLTNILLPATILKSMTGINNGVNNRELLYVILLYFLMMGIAGAIGWLLSKLLSIQKDERGILMSVVMYMNISFVGFPLVESYYGSEGMFYAGLSCVPMNILMFSVGVATISGNWANGMKLKQIFNIPLLATLMGIVLMISRIEIPEIISGTVYSIANATIPVSMLILGSSLAAIPVKLTVKDLSVFAAVLCRLLLCPILTFYLLGLFVDNTLLLGTITILASTPVAVLVTPLCIQYGKGDRLSSKSIFISTVLSVITMPLIIRLLL